LPQEVRAFGIARHRLDRQRLGQGRIDEGIKKREFLINHVAYCSYKQYLHDVKIERNSLPPLAKRQGKILTFIQKCISDEGKPPTHDEIRREFGLKSTSGVRQHLKLIQKKGYIELCAGKSRGIRVLLPAVDDVVPSGVMEIPVVGCIAAGLPILAEEQLEQKIAVSEALFPRGVLFALRVQGNSMVKVGITDGDLAVIRQQERVEDGEIAAVQIGDEATLKRVYAGSGKIRLKAENDAFPDRVFANGSGADIHVLGRYVGLIRSLR